MDGQPRFLLMQTSDESIRHCTKTHLPRCGGCLHPAHVIGSIECAQLDEELDKTKDCYIFGKLCLLSNFVSLEYISIEPGLQHF